MDNTSTQKAPRINAINSLSNAKPINVAPKSPAQKPSDESSAPKLTPQQIQALKLRQEALARAKAAQSTPQMQIKTKLTPKPQQPIESKPQATLKPQTPIELDSDSMSLKDFGIDLSQDVKSSFLAEKHKDKADASLVVDVEKLDFAVTKKVRGYLKKLISVDGSDLHLKANSYIRARIKGDIVIFSNEIFTKEEAITFAKELTRTRFSEFVANKEMDLTYIYDVKTRFRVNIFFQMEGVSFAFRTIPTTQNTIEDLGLPEAIHDIVNMERGLVLVTGITGSGKSTTLAAIINAINHKYAKHIITIEDPIEFVHKDIKCMINQRSVGMDTNSFAGALKSALREDPDIILVGEMRDIETIEMALHAAETGHLVLSTLHTLDAKETINRIISVFPTTDQQRVRKILANVLNAIVSQRLLKKIDGNRIAAIELLFKTPRIEMIIEEGRDGEIAEALAEGHGIYKTQTFDQHLFELITSNIVSEESAMEKATSPSDLKLRLQNINFADAQGIGEIGIKS